MAFLSTKFTFSRRNGLDTLSSPGRGNKVEQDSCRAWLTPRVLHAHHQLILRQNNRSWPNFLHEIENKKKAYFGILEARWRLVGRIFGGTLASLFSIDFLWTLGGGNICNLKEKHCQDCNQYNRVKNPQTLLHSHVVKGARIKIDRKLDPQRNLFSFQSYGRSLKMGNIVLNFPFGWRSW